MHRQVVDDLEVHPHVRKTSDQDARVHVRDPITQQQTDDVHEYARVYLFYGWFVERSSVRSYEEERVDTRCTRTVYQRVRETINEEDVREVCVRVLLEHETGTEKGQVRHVVTRRVHVLLV